MHIDEQTAGAVLRAVDEEPPGPSTVDIHRAVRVGLRRRRARRLGGYTVAAGTAAVVLAGAGVAAAGWHAPGRSTNASDRPAASGSAADQAATPGPTSCTLQQLPLPDGRTMGLVTGGDPTGRYLLGRSYPEHQSGGGMDLHVIVWDRLRPSIVTVPGDDQDLTDINSKGIAVGSGYGSAGPVGYFYRAGTVAKLPGGDGAEPRAINEAGAVVGIRAERPVVWHSVDQAPVQLALPTGATTGRAVDIDEDGTVIGSVGTTAGDQSPYLWAPDGTGHAITVPAGVPTASAGAAAGASGVRDGKTPGALVYHIRNGWVTGRVQMTAIRWNLHSGQTQQFPEFQDFAEGINRNGWQIGLTRAGAALVTDRAQVPLPELAKHRPGGLSNIPTTVSDDGTLVGGQSDDGSNVIHAVVWNCS